jgi:hypothetical protein
MIRDTATFAKLYPVKVPCPQHADYYLSRLLGARRLLVPLSYSWLPQALQDFAELEAERGGKLGDLVHRHRERVVTELGARTSLLALEPPPGFQQLDTIASAAGKLLGRIDLVSANYSAVRLHNPELPTWEDLCAELGIPAAIARSKSFRQSALGRVNPKWQQRVQARTIQAVIESIAALLPGFLSRIVRCSPDEIVFHVDNPHEMRLFARVAAAASMPARFETFILRRLSFAKAFTWVNTDLRSGSPISVQPFMVPGNRFYMWLTRAVYCSPVIDLRDVTYLDDGQETCWAYGYNNGPAHVDGAEERTTPK